jgi:hypothetical protein
LHCQEKWWPWKCQAAADNNARIQLPLPQGVAKTTMMTHIDRNKNSPMILTPESMKKPGAFVTIFKNFAFIFLTK